MTTIEKYIPIGKDNAIHQRELAELLEVTPAVVKLLVRNARKAGAQILSGQRGYWIAKDDNERREFIRMLSKQATTRLQTAQPIKSTLQEINGQMSLSDVISGAYNE